MKKRYKSLEPSQITNKQYDSINKAQKELNKILNGLRAELFDDDCYIVKVSIAKSLTSEFTIQGEIITKIDIAGIRK